MFKNKFIQVERLHGAKETIILVGVINDRITGANYRLIDKFSRFYL